MLTKLPISNRCGQGGPLGTLAIGPGNLIFAARSGLVGIPRVRVRKQHVVLIHERFFWDLILSGSDKEFGYWEQECGIVAIWREVRKARRLSPKSNSPMSAQRLRNCQNSLPIKPSASGSARACFCHGRAWKRPGIPATARLWRPRRST
jgi:hypothetical protein